MGNCVSCRESAPQVETPVVTPPPTQITETKDVVVAVKNGQHRHSLTVMDNLHNGNLKSATSGSASNLHRERSVRVLRIQPMMSRTESKHKEVSDVRIQALFDTYKDASEPNFILAEGIETLLNDLNLAPDEFKVLVLAWKLNAEQMCQFSKEEFCTGLRGLKADALPTLIAKLNDACQEVLSDPDQFKDLYRFTFRFGLDTSVGQRILPTDMATCLWRIVFSIRPSALLERWLEYLGKIPNGGVPRDTWDMYLYLTDQVGADLSLYDDSHAWPSVFDDFVENENDRTNQNVAKSKDQPVIDDCT